MIDGAAEAIFGYRSAHSFATGPVIADLPSSRWEKPGNVEKSWHVLLNCMQQHVTGISRIEHPLRDESPQPDPSLAGGWTRGNLASTLLFHLPDLAILVVLVLIVSAL